MFIRCRYGNILQIRKNTVFILPKKIVIEIFYWHYVINEIIKNLSKCHT